MPAGRRSMGQLAGAFPLCARERPGAPPLAADRGGGAPEVVGAAKLHSSTFREHCASLMPMFAGLWPHASSEATSWSSVMRTERDFKLAAGRQPHRRGRTQYQARRIPPAPAQRARLLDTGDRGTSRPDDGSAPSSEGTAPAHRRHVALITGGPRAGGPRGRPSSRARFELQFDENNDRLGLALALPPPGPPVRSGAEARSACFYRRSAARARRHSRPHRPHSSASAFPSAIAADAGPLTVSMTEPLPNSSLVWPTPCTDPM